MHSQIRAIVFDFDNTLVDFDYSSKKSFKQLVKKYKLAKDKNSYSLYEKYNYRAWRLYEQGKLDAQMLRILRFELYLKDIQRYDLDPFQLNLEYLEGILLHTTPMPNALEVLKQLREPYVLVMATNGFKEIQRRRMDKIGITEFFGNHIWVSDEIGERKPHRAFFELLYGPLSMMGIDKNEVLMVGDSIKSDILGGKKFGMKTCWLCRDKNRPKHDAADIVIHNLKSLLRLLT